MTIGMRVEALRPKLLTLANNLTGDRELAEDLVQDTCLHIMRKADKYDETRGPFSSWAYGVMKNMWRSHVRRPAFSREFCVSEFSSYETQDMQVVDVESEALDKLDAGAFIATLKDRDRHTLYALQSFDTKQAAADYLGITRFQLATRIKHLRRMLVSYNTLHN